MRRQRSTGRTAMIGVSVCLLAVAGPLLAESDIKELLPPVSSLGNWTQAVPASTYTAETLFEYLDGGAPQYTSYGFVKLVHARYAYRGQELASVVLDVFDMGSPLGAYGIYSSGRPRENQRRPWGTEGYRAGTIAAAWKDHFYVYGSADEDSEPLVTMLERLVAGVCSRIPGEAVKPKELSVFPADGLVPQSDRYIGRDLLGHDFLGGGFLAHYVVSGRESLLFFSDLRTPAEARRSFGLLSAHDRERERWLREERSVGDEGFWSRDPAHGVRLQVRFGRWIAGIWEIDDESRARHLLAELLEGLVP